MIYLDYSATTPVNDEVLESFVKASKNFIGNPNSLHKLGVDSKRLIEQATSQIKSLLNVFNSEIIYTSGSTEANNLAIKGICDMYSNRGKKIITTKLEHSSIYGPLDYLKKKGFIVEYVDTKDGIVDLDNLRKIITDDTILVSINAVNSEMGFLQPIDEIGKIVKEYNKCYFHVDMTQAIGKVKINLDNVDLFSFAAHKFYGLKGIGALVINNNLIIEPILHGGKSTTDFRSGTPALPLIVSLAKALRLALQDLNTKYEYIKNINSDLVNYLNDFEKVKINSNINSIPHILNISVLGVKPESLLHALESHEVYVSTQSACSKSNSKSEAVLYVTNDVKRASSSIRISLSYLTSKEEIEEFKRVFKKCYEELTCLV